jgi:hypothetical protein
MMRIVGLVLALLVVSGMAYAATQTCQMDVYDQYSFIGPPLVPLAPNPAAIFGPAGVDIEWTGVITRFDAPQQGEIAYLAFDPNQQWNMLLGEGYRVDYTAGTLPSVPTTVTYEGIPDGVPSGTTMTDMWISLPGNQFDGLDVGGSHWISTPFNHPIPFNYTPYDGANIKVTDGNTVRTLMDAANGSPQWLQEPFSYYDGAAQGMLSAGWFTGVYNDDQMEPGVCYIVNTVKDNIALIVPAVPAP